MANIEETVEGEEETPKKKSKKPMIIGLILALGLGGGGFYAVYSGMIFGTADPHEAVDAEHGEAPTELPPIAFVPLDPLVISLGGASNPRHLRFRAELEVEPAYQDDVTELVPRVLDVLNSYLRAVELRDLENSSALVNLRAQMLRRIQLVTGEGRVRDLLIMEFVLN
ncbi:MAG: flagellar basal body protein FliL [Rhodobacteraceae bacterium]|nr:flagellar basal body protein FliL [Paracoccaceae bacterium]